MYYIDGPGATADHKFTEGDPAAGVAATTVTDDFMNDVQEEILNVIRAAGIVPAKNVQDQLLQAIRGAGANGLFTTPPQFDNTKKGATTEFVQRALGSFRGFGFGSVNRTITAADIGTAIYFGAAGMTHTLPTPASLSAPVGASVTFFTTNVPGTVAPGAGASINYDLSSIPSLTIKGGQCATFMVVGPAIWQVVNSSAEMSRNADFASARNLNGYQKLPGGMIHQWGQTGALGPGASNSPIVFPIAFPSSIFSGGPFNSYAAGGPGPATAAGVAYSGNTGFNISLQGPNGMSSVPWFAIGI